jgi:3-oxoacyl-[acyl-carrier-protein] synthase II
MRIKPIYINGTGVISIQQPLSVDGIFNPVSYDCTHVRCVEPNFKDYFEPMVARRMSRIIKRSIITAQKAIEESGSGNPDAILTGTGLGCVEETEKFLVAMIKNEEKFLQPTFFIQSTHNTVSSQIAINLGCKGYNNTYIHRGVSFENALMDAVLLFNRELIHTALVTGNDEMTPSYFSLLNRIGYWKDAVEDTLKIVNEGTTKGSFAGEGSLSFALSDKKSATSYAAIQGIDLFYKPNVPVSEKINDFLTECGLSTADIDVFLTGMNGDVDNDTVYKEIAAELFDESQIGIYKNVCGEFYTSDAFGLLVSAACLQKNEIPPHLMVGGKKKKNLKNILLYNHFRNKDHSLILVTTCSDC